MRLHPDDITAIAKQVIDGLLAAKKARKPRKTKAEAYTDDFEACWGAYPKVANNSKQSAFRAFSARVAEGVDCGFMYQQTIKYAKFCESTGRIESGKVLLAATFYGPDKRYEADFTPPKEARTPEWAKLPRENEKLWDFAKEYKFSNPGSIPNHMLYRKKLQQEIDQRIARGDT